MRNQTLAARLKDAAKHIAYHSGALSELHRRRNRDTLTVVMFHRVLDPRDPRWAGADPEYTLSQTLFDAFLRFLVKHYNVVGLDQVHAAYGEGERLPARALLITFDDGWADTADYAAPVLQRHGLPAAIFVVAEAIGRRQAFWHEEWFAAWAEGRLRPGRLAELWQETTGEAAPPDLLHDQGARQRFLAALQNLALPERWRLLQDCLETQASDGPAQMISAAQLRELRGQRLVVGSHGCTHEPLTGVPDPAEELVQSREVLKRHGVGPPMALSFPHGRYDAKVVAASRAAGYRPLFTSEVCLNPIRDGRPSSDLVGRLSPSAAAITIPDGRFAPHRLARLLFTAPIRPPDDPTQDHRSEAGV